jgi:hypothetical protein
VRDIEKGAKLTIIENEKLGPKLARYQPRPAIDRKSIAAIACLKKPATDEAAGRVA